VYPYLPPPFPAADGSPPAGAAWAAWRERSRLWLVPAAAALVALAVVGAVIAAIVRSHRPAAGSAVPLTAGRAAPSPPPPPGPRPARPGGRVAPAGPPRAGRRGRAARPVPAPAQTRAGRQPGPLEAAVSSAGRPAARIGQRNRPPLGRTGRPGVG